ncbi:EF-hand domain-containing protein [Ensifer sp. 4252]|uniref:EF-hand domain-containing protein n=1 Tax=Ensifer sp. 4252 TaxID=3373915 RepID=UPI003D231D01
MRKVALLMAAVLCQLVPVAAQDKPAAMYQGQMDRLDRDGDGAISRPEYQGFMTTAFASLDKNKDGTLSAAEAAPVLNAQQFAAINVNRDGKITQSEFLNSVMADFKAADSGGDGSLQ